MREIANNIVDTCDEIEDCKLVLSCLKKDASFASISVEMNAPDDFITVFLSNVIAVEAVKKQLSILEAEYKSLKNQAYVAGRRK
jgi:hypothetical protein